VAIMTADPGEMRELILPALRAGWEMHENYTPGTDAGIGASLFDSGEQRRSGQRRTGARMTESDLKRIQLHRVTG
jgi:hypothetical protein